MNRVRRTLALGAVVIVGGAVFGWANWPSSEPALACDPSQVGLDDAGVARCGAAGALPAAQALTVGQPLDLNVVTEQELALIPGVGPVLAKAIVERRAALGGFRTLADLDAVPGVGEHKFEALRLRVRLSEFDAGL